MRKHSSAADVAVDDRHQVSHSSFARITHHGRLLAIRARYSGSNFGSSGPYIAETFGRTPSFLCVLQLHEFPAADAWCDDRHRRLPRLSSGAVHIYDLRHEWRTDARHPFDNIHVNVTQEALNELAEELCLRPIAIELPAALAEARGETLRHLALALQPAFARPKEMSALFADHVVTAAAIHLAETYGCLKPGAAQFRGGLAQWQERRARDMLTEGLHADIPLRTIAAACGLSTGHFIKAFRQTTGLPPHRWQLKQRAERSRDMLLHTREPLDVIALACGFADQSHLSRVFSKAFGVPPGTWRRMHRS